MLRIVAGRRLGAGRRVRRERIDPEVNARCVALADASRRGAARGVRDVVVGYCSVAVYFDPLRIDAAWLEARDRARRAGRLDVETCRRGALVEVPVCYGGDFGPDLADVAAFAGCSEDEVDRRCTPAATYRVFMLGFVPGFAYMGAVDPRIAVPRRATPRTRGAGWARSASPAGRPASIRPRRPAAGSSSAARRCSRSTRSRPSRSCSGRRSRAVPCRFDATSSGSRDLHGRSPSFAPGHADDRAGPRPLGVSRRAACRWPGRWTRTRIGSRTARRQPPDDAATLEVTLIGPELRGDADDDVRGRGRDVRADASDDGAGPMHAPFDAAARRAAAVRRAAARARARLSPFSGGIDVPAVLGSRATQLISGMGRSAAGRCRAGDGLPLGAGHGARHAGAGAICRVPLPLPAGGAGCASSPVRRTSCSRAQALETLLRVALS